MYMPWEGYNSEDAVLISERLVYEDIYTSFHIRKYEIQTHVTSHGPEKITKEIPHLEAHLLRNLDKNGIEDVSNTKETIQLITTHNEDRIHAILHFSTNILSFVILSGYSSLGNQELLILNSWVREFLYNLSDTIKAFSILLLADLCIGFHSIHGWELMIGSLYKDFGFAQNDQIISGRKRLFTYSLFSYYFYYFI
ncbi:hypothetical protein HN51_024453 [Arachis hypogaea]